MKTISPSNLWLTGFPGNQPTDTSTAIGNPSDSPSADQFSNPISRKLQAFEARDASIGQPNQSVRTSWPALDMQIWR